MFDLGVRMGLEKVAAGVAAVVGAEDPASGRLEDPGHPSDIRGDVRDPGAAREPAGRRRRKRTKTAENSSQSVGNGDVAGSGAQTPGELEAFISASDVTGSTFHRVRTGPGSGRQEKAGRPRTNTGVPIWIRYAKALQSPSTRGAGDKSGPQRDDKQMFAPGTEGNP